MAGLPGPGDRIEARCTRCNDITGHVIVALVGGEIVKVEFRRKGMYIPGGKLGRLASKREYFPFDKRQMEEGTI